MGHAGREQSVKQNEQTKTRFFPELTTQILVFRKKENGSRISSYMFHEAVPPCAANMPSLMLRKNRDAHLQFLAAPRKEIPPQSLPNPRPPRHTRLPLHLVGLVTVPEVERGGEVAAKELLVLDGGQDGLVDGLLVAGTGAGNLLLL